MPKNVKGGTLWDFLNIHSVAKYQKIDGGPFGAIKKFRKKEKFEQSHSDEKGEFHSVKKSGKATLLLWNGFCVENEVLSTYGKSAYGTKSGPIALN